MSILVSGSVAFDTLISVVGTFKSQIIPEALDSFNMSLFIPSLKKEFGGAAANIAYNLALLGKKPSVIASVGGDAHEYLDRLSKLGVNTDHIKIIGEKYSPQGFMIGDEIGRQIIAFHAGAMDHSGEVELAHNDFSHAIIAPDSKNGILTRVSQCKENGIFAIFDPGQAMGLFSGDELKQCVLDTQLTIMNEYESELFKSLSGTDLVDFCRANSRVCIITLGALGTRIVDTESDEKISAIKVEKVVEATGCGDALRAGLLYGLSESWDLKKSIKLGSILAGIKISFHGGQNHTFTRELVSEIGVREYREKFFG